MVPQVALYVAGTLVENCCVAFSLKVCVDGVRVKVGGAAIVSEAVAVYAVPPVAVAVIVQTDPCVVDAVKRPEELMLPQVAVHATAMLAVNCWVSPAPVVVLAGDMAIGEVTVTFALALLPPPYTGMALMVQDPGTSGAV